MHGRLAWEGPVKEYLRTCVASAAWYPSWGTFGGHVDSLGTPRGLIFLLLGRLLVSFWRSWLGPLGTAFRPKLVQDNEKNTSFEFWDQDLGPKLGPKIKKNRRRKRCFLRCVFYIVFYRFFFDVGLRKSTFWLDFRS